MIIRAFITHKKAEYFADCQDRFSVSKDTKSIAVSDGMGSTWQQKIWAQLLAESYTKDPEWIPNIESVKNLSPIWRKEVLAFIQKLIDENAPQNIIIRNERSLAEGRSAGATFVGIRFSDYNWKGAVLGDSCLIEWDGREAKFNTSQDVDTFDSYPDYFDSDDTKDGRGEVKEISGELKDGSYLLLVSDPFSDFLLNHQKQGDISEYIDSLLHLSSHEEFEALVSDWRDLGMHNDDTTLVIVGFDSSVDFSIPVMDNISELIQEEKEILEAQLIEEQKQSIIEVKTEDESNNIFTSNTSETLSNAALILASQVESRDTDKLESDSIDQSDVLLNEVTERIKKLVRNECLQGMLISLIQKIRHF